MYFGAAHLLETTLDKKYTTEIEEQYLGDSKLLFDGRLSVGDAVNKNITLYLKNINFLFSELEIDVTVISKKGVAIYPPADEDAGDSFAVNDFLKIASDNYSILDEGLKVNVTVSLERDSLLSIAIFSVFLIISLIFLYLCYIGDRKKITFEAEVKNDEILRLREFEKENSNRLSELSKESDVLKDSLTELRKQAADATRNEDGMLEEVIRLEEEVSENLSRQKIQQEEIDLLNEQIEKLKYGKKKGGRQKTKNRETILRRFKALYKNIIVHDRAVDGYSELEEDLKLKCEEVIHQLNEAPEKVTVKRKVFGRKGRETVLEVLFAYKGRLYFRNSKRGKAEVLAVGTKNTQARELEFLDKL